MYLPFVFILLLFSSFLNHLRSLVGLNATFYWLGFEFINAKLIESKQSN